MLGLEIKSPIEIVEKLIDIQIILTIRVIYVLIEWNVQPQVE